MKTAKVINFKETGLISQDLLQELSSKGKPYGLEKIIPFRSELIITAEWVNLKCRYGCNLYNTSWCCPPAHEN